MGDLDQAIALCQEHLEGQAGNMNGHVVYGQALFDAGRYEEAEATFTTALTLDPENLIALRHLGDIARTTNDAPKALDWYKRVLDADPRNDEILGFIEELKAMAAAAAPPPPTVAAVAASSAPTPVATRAVPDEGKTVEITPVKRSSAANATPMAAMGAVEPVASPAPAKRMSLLDMSIDLGGVSESGVGAGLGAEMDLTPPLSAPTPRATTPVAQPAVAQPAVAQPAVAQPAVEVDNGLGWDMGSIDLTAADGLQTASSEPAAAETPQVFVTETMAELYLQQGFRDEALQVYRQLSEQNPGDASIRERIRNLEQGDRASMSFDVVGDDLPDLAPGTDSLIMMSDAPAAEPEAAAPEFDAPPIGDAPEFDALPMIDSFAGPPLTRPSTEVARRDLDLPADEPVAAPALVSARTFFALLAQRRAVRRDGTPAQPIAAVSAEEPALAMATVGGSLDSLFGTAPTDTDEAIGQALATAVGAVDSAPIRGKPTQAAASELTLDSVFRGESAARSSGPVPRPSEVLKFDQFFAPTDAPAPALDSAADSAPDSAADPNAPPASPADDAQFNSWLQGLKDQ